MNIVFEMERQADRFSPHSITLNIREYPKPYGSELAGYELIGTQQYSHRGCDPTYVLQYGWPSDIVDGRLLDVARGYIDSLLREIVRQ